MPSTEVFIGNAQCRIIQITNVSLECTVGATVGGEHLIYVTVDKMGTARNPNQVMFSSLITVTTMSTTVGSFGGGMSN